MSYLIPKISIVVLFFAICPQAIACADDDQLASDYLESMQCIVIIKCAKDSNGEIKEVIEQHLKGVLPEGTEDAAFSKMSMPKMKLGQRFLFCVRMIGDEYRTIKLPIENGAVNVFAYDQGKLFDGNVKLDALINKLKRK